MALANRAGLDLATDYPWQALRITQTFTTTATQPQAAAFPADFDRFIPNTFFNRTTRRPITGPITPRQYEWIQAQPVYSAVYLAFIERSGQFLVVPNPAAGNTIAYEYISVNWAKGPSPTFTPQPAFVTDADTSFLDEDQIIRGTKWRFLSAKGLDYSEELDAAERAQEQLMARDGGSTALSLAPQMVDGTRQNLPDGNFGL